MDYYSQIFRRKSFHMFRGSSGPLSPEELGRVGTLMTELTPLDPSIRTEIRLVREEQTSSRRGAEYCVLFYSEKKGDYLRNVGYMGQQLDLLLTAENIGTLWLGMAKPDRTKCGDLDYVIMIALAKMPEDKFRRDMFKAKRKPLDQVWQGETLGVGEIARFAPSAVNSQPWLTVCSGDALTVYRVRPGKLGFVPAKQMVYYNRIDMGIYLFILETCLRHEGFSFQRETGSDPESADESKTLTAVYRLSREPDRQAQLFRIAENEALMHEARQLLDSLPAAPENASRLRELADRLDRYYGSGEWKRDFADDEAGLLPKDLPRGVLSEDGLYDLLEECREALNG